MVEYFIMYQKHFSMNTVDQRASQQVHRYLFEAFKHKTEGPFLIQRQNNSRKSCYPKTDQWSLRENAKYAAFIEMHVLVMEGIPHAKVWSIYRKMEVVIGTRNFRQYKLHHQKLLNNYQTITNIVSNLKRRNKDFALLVAQESKILFNQQNLKTDAQKNKIKEEKQTDKQIPLDGKVTKEDNVKTSDKYSHQMDKSSQANSQLAKQQKIPSKPKSNNQEWLECHQLFVAWVSRMNQLMLDYPEP